MLDPRQSLEFERPLVELENKIGELKQLAGGELLAAEIKIDDFSKVDLRIAKIVKDHGFELVDHVLHIRALAPVTDAPKRPARKLS